MKRLLLSCLLVGCGAAPALRPTTRAPESGPYVVDLAATGELTYVVWSNGRVEQWGMATRQEVFTEVGTPIAEVETFGSTVCVRTRSHAVWCGAVLEPPGLVMEAEEGRLLVGGRPIGDHVCLTSAHETRCVRLTDQESWNPSPPVPVSQLTIGRFHACGVEGSRAGCWGAGNNGAIDGVLVGDDSSLPTFPPDLDRDSPRALHAGPLRTCAVLRSGELWCFGRHDGMRWPDWRSPTHTRARHVEGTYVDVFVSDHHACALDE
ncbi:MAG: hypothetical protein KC586_27695, partial [Myxococcales bacterium]|nr:hypothetical protein [Myxococcales bacterium]